MLAEAELIGITGGGGLTTYGRAILTGAPALATETLALALPEPVADFLLQPDLTMVVPGPPTADLARELMLVADLESAGGASVYRLTEASLRRAFDAGRTAADLSALFASRSRTPVPQSLTYLVEDLARRHGVLRAGDAVSYLRCDDTGLLDRAVSDRAVASLKWHRLAPTVAVSPATTARVLDVLREAGYAPAAEDAGGGTVAIGADPSRSRPRRPESTRNVPAFGVREEQFAEAVRRMRTGDELSRTAHKVSVNQDIPGVTSASTLGVLRDAIRADQQVWVSYVDAAGSSVSKIIAPLSLGGGFLRGHDVDTKEFRSIPLQPRDVGERSRLTACPQDAHGVNRISATVDSSSTTARSQSASADAAIRTDARTDVVMTLSACADPSIGVPKTSAVPSNSIRSRRSSRDVTPSIRRSTVPVTTTKIRCTPGNAENGAGRSRSARLTRHAKSSGVRSVASSCVRPAPLRHGTDPKSPARTITASRSAAHPPATHPPAARERADGDRRDGVGPRAPGPAARAVS